MADVAVSAATRSPLAEATNRINSSYPAAEEYSASKRYDYSAHHHAADAYRANYANAQQNYANRAAANAHAANHNAHVSAVLQPPQEMEENKRLSQASYASSASSRSRNYKTHIGPWQLGKTLGKGSSARVRLCRHNITHELAAVKIVNRRMAYLVQDSSLAALSKWDNSMPERLNGEMRVPMSIEREVAILKLIEHPNIMKLYDIWENRSEIYLILEYVDQGDLFTFINSKGRLSEEVSLFFFRQMISAMTYCHSFNICHRDLKPENILITADLQLKIADFGMAALHQTDTHQLATACGSPHYAAPELLKNRQYRGDRADIWSMGVILYAMLSATLPFDDPDLRVMMGKTKKGQYSMPEGLSLEAEDLIRRMLTVNPDRRITLKEIWRHPLVQRYSYLDDYDKSNGQLPDTRKGFQYNPVPRVDIDDQLLRQLRSMWHMFSENDLMLKLTCEEPNDQKAFYWLLHDYRDKQLEDFKPELAHSMSDYHHLKPSAWKKRISTCEFSQPRLNGTGRSISRFTVISNAAETEAGTIQSYDPYRGSRILQACDSPASQARVTVHRDIQSSSGYQVSRARSGSNARRGRMTVVRTSTKGSLTSVHSSRQGTPHHVRGASLRHKRGVDFTHVRKQSTSSGRPRRGSHRAPPAYVTEDGSTYRLEAPRDETPEMPSLPSGLLPKPTRQQTLEPKEMTDQFNEELRHFSSNIARDCDEAFRSSLIEEESIAGSLTNVNSSRRNNTPFSFVLDGPNGSPSAEDAALYGSRPLPPLPSVNQLIDDRSLLPTPLSSRPVSRDESMMDGETPADEIRLALPVLLPRHADRRIVSAPAYSQNNNKPSGSLPPINETGVSNDKTRIVSAPPHTPSRKPNERTRSMEYLSKKENTIRVVHSPSGSSPMKVPAPLNVRKKSATHAPERSTQLKMTAPAESFDEMAADTSIPQRPDVMKKKRSWFKRLSKADSETINEPVDWQDLSSVATSIEPARSDSASVNVPTKKKSFNFPFWKSNKARDSKMSIAGSEEKQEEPNPAPKPAADGRISRQGKWHESSSGEVRNIEVKQNWLARLFRVKPATRHVCMVISRRRARQEVALLLRQWRKYGIRGIQIDKQRNIVFARVAAKNFLELKEVHFAAEVVTVIEHGRKQPLSIIRFTQERGAASSFHKVVDTMKVVFENRGLLVVEKSKQKMMIKTLNTVV